MPAIRGEVIAEGPNPCAGTESSLRWSANLWSQILEAIAMHPRWATPTARSSSSYSKADQSSEDSRVGSVDVAKGTITVAGRHRVCTDFVPSALLLIPSATSVSL
jgi:hypothetical protein